MKVKGKGSFGCVIEPAIQCNNKSFDKDKVGKLFLDKKYADEEIETLKQISQLNADKEYTGEVYGRCTVPYSYNVENMCEFNEDRVSSSKKSKTTEKNYHQIIMDNNGIPVHKLLQTDKSTSNSNVKGNMMYFEDILHLFIPLLHGLHKLNFNHKMIHADISADNILYNKSKDKLVLIDFGLTKPTQNYLKLDRVQKFNHYNKDYQPFEICALGRLKVLNVLTNEGTLVLGYDKKKIINDFKSILINYYGQQFMKTLFPNQDVNDPVDGFSDVFDKVAHSMYNSIFDNVNPETNELKKEYIDKISKKLDVFSIGKLLFSQCVSASKKKLVKNEEFVKEKVYPLIAQMTTVDALSRLTPKEAAEKLERILKKSKIIDIKDSMYNNPIFKGSDSNNNDNAFYIPPPPKSVGNKLKKKSKALEAITEEGTMNNNSKPVSIQNVVIKNDEENVKDQNVVMKNSQDKMKNNPIFGSSDSTNNTNAFYIPPPPKSVEKQSKTKSFQNEVMKNNPIFGGSDSTNNTNAFYMPPPPKSVEKQSKTKSIQNDVMKNVEENVKDQNVVIENSQTKINNGQTVKEETINNREAGNKQKLKQQYKKRCKPGQVLNPRTGRCIKKDGKMGKIVVNEKCIDENKIMHPVKKICVLKNGPSMQKYHNDLKQKCENEGKFLNPSTKKCIIKDGIPYKNYIKQLRQECEKAGKFMNPLTNKCIFKDKETYKKYIKTIQENCEKNGKFMNPITYRCISKDKDTYKNYFRKLKKECENDGKQWDSVSHKCKKTN